MTTHLFDVLAEVTAREQPSACFALLGDANMNWGTVLQGHGVRMVYVRHEHCAVAAAMAHARKTGQVGLATVTCGPGLTQLMTALPAAVHARIPLVVFAGEAPLRSGWYNQQIDQAPLVVATGAAYVPLHHAGRAAEGLRDAFLRARMERRPVVVGVPFDVQESALDGLPKLPDPSAYLVPHVAPMAPHPDDIGRAADRIRAARRIVLMGGMGAVESGAGPAIQALADRCDALVGTTLPARGLFAGDAFNIGVVGGFSSDHARACLGQADLIVAFGSILSHHNADGGRLFPNAHVIQVDTAPAAISQGRVAAHSHVRADARLAALALADAIAPRAPDWRSPAMAAGIAGRVYDAAPFQVAPGTLDPRDVTAALEDTLPQDWQMVNSSGHCSYYVAHMPSRRQENFLTIREFGAIGNGISFAMGVAVARPDQTVVLFDGDGSLLMHIQELETIRRNGLNIVICVFNDGAYGSEIHKLRAEGLPDTGAVFGRPDFAAIARGFGLRGARVDELSALPALVAEQAAMGGAAIWDFPISDAVVSPVIRRAHAKHYGTN